MKDKTIPDLPSYLYSKYIRQKLTALLEKINKYKGIKRFGTLSN